MCFTLRSCKLFILVGLLRPLVRKYYVRNQGLMNYEKC